MRIRKRKLSSIKGIINNVVTHECQEYLENIMTSEIEMVGYYELLDPIQNRTWISIHDIVENHLRRWTSARSL